MIDPRLNDKWWRLTHLYKIKDKQGRLVTFKPNSIQLKHLEERSDHRYNYILKARQFGFTTLYCIDLLDEALWVPGMSCAITAHEREAVLKIFQIVKRAHDNLPPNILPKSRYDTKTEYQFTQRYDGLPLDSSIYVALKVRAGTVQKLHVTESAYVKDRQELKAGSKQAVPITGSISEETTGNGFNEFYDDYEVAREDPNPAPHDYKTYFYPWVASPEYTLPGTLEVKTDEEAKIIEIAKRTYGLDVTDGQLIWRRWKMKELRRKQEGVGLTGEQLFKQEYPLTVTEAFQSGAGNVFDAERIDAAPRPEALEGDAMIAEIQARNIPEADKTKQLEWLRFIINNEGKIYHMPEYGRKYTIGVDPSDGEGSDFGAVSVWIKNKGIEDKKIKVAEYYGKRRPDDLAYIASQFGWFYNEAFIGVENNMLSCILELIKIYDNYFYTMRIDERTQKRTKKIGWNTNSKTRDVMIDDFVKLFEEDELEINSNRTFSEMRTFVKKENGKREHADNKFDDMLFADFIAIQMQKFDEPRARGFTNKPF